jgi:hypothetical protein
MGLSQKFQMEIKKNIFVIGFLRTPLRLEGTTREGPFFNVQSGIITACCELAQLLTAVFFLILR